MKLGEASERARIACVCNNPPYRNADALKVPGCKHLVVCGTPATSELPVPLNYVIDPGEQLITITGEYADAEEWTALLSRILGDPALRPGFAFLRDLRSATTPVDAATVVRLMEAVRRFWPLLQPSRAAVLTPREFDPAAMTAHAIADNYGLPLRMFTSHEAALEWLRER